MRLELRTFAAAAGRVVDAQSGRMPDASGHIVDLATGRMLEPETAGEVGVDTKKPLPGSLVEIVSGPPEFERRRASLRQDRQWAALPERLDRTAVRQDGAFVFRGLPPGAYQLRIVPAAGGRLGAATGYRPETTVTLTVFDERDAAGRLRLEPVIVEVPPTRLLGRVTRADDTPIEGARVILVGDGRAVRTDADGHYRLQRFVASRVIVEVSAAGFASKRSDPVVIEPGADHTVDFQLAAAD